MNRYLIGVVIFCVLAATVPAIGMQRVLTGLEVFERNGFPGLDGKRVALVTNHTAVTADGRHIIDIFYGRGIFDLVALFSPEHGIRGTEDTFVDSTKDEKTGLPIHSLYGKIKKPTPEMLEGVDVLVFDIQDIGARFYTYITTMAHAMEAAAENGLSIFVLDRPNPIAGTHVEGFVLDESLAGGFAYYYPIPTRHGMTVGELALLFNQHFDIHANLMVIKMEGWRRAMWFDETGLPWINPSPNMRSLTQATFYPGLGILESTNMSVGRGTPRPFELYGAPWIDPAQLVRELRKTPMPGIQFYPASFIPDYSTHQGKQCHGFEAILLDREKLNITHTALVVFSALYRLYPDSFDMNRMGAMVGDNRVAEQIAAGVSVERIMSERQPRFDEFLKVRERFLLYE